MFDVTESVGDFTSFSLISQTLQESSSLCRLASVEIASDWCFHGNGGFWDQGIMGNAVLQQDTESR